MITESFNMDNSIKNEINVLPQKYWLSFETKHNKNNFSKKYSAGNITALIISELTELFPELETCSESKFINFQDRITKILAQHLAPSEIKTQLQSD